MVYTHVLNNGRCPVRSPLDQLATGRPAVIDGGRMQSIIAPTDGSGSPQLPNGEAHAETRRESPLPRYLAIAARFWDDTSVHLIIVMRQRCLYPTRSMSTTTSASRRSGVIRSKKSKPLWISSTARPTQHEIR